MKKIFTVSLALVGATAAFAQITPILKNKPPQKQTLPVPEVVTLKPDLTVELESVSSATYMPSTKKTVIKAIVVVKNSSSAPAPKCKIASSSYHHSSTNIDHVYWHIGPLIDMPAIPANGTVRRIIVFAMDEMPNRTTPYPFKVEIDKSYIVDEANETNNESNEIDITVNRAS